MRSTWAVVRPSRQQSHSCYAKIDALLNAVSSMHPCFQHAARVVALRCICLPVCGVFPFLLQARCIFSSLCMQLHALDAHASLLPGTALLQAQCSSCTAPALPLHCRSVINNKQCARLFACRYVYKAILKWCSHTSSTSARMITR